MAFLCLINTGNSPSNHVIYTVGSRWNEGNSNEDEMLKSCYITSLNITEDNKIEAIAFPNISTEIYEFSKINPLKLLLKQ
ncbi:macro domain-containing protein [Formosa sp. L2A11]|uniref:macro domain-containing protein n=1 Tax=Formosa sp. L2A11 TaxID=2686363 RepID=UPI00131CED5C|nr:macro domain-containing protein [Formosa sp. L2A11]